MSKPTRSLITALAAATLLILGLAPATASAATPPSGPSSTIDTNGLEGDCEAWALTDRKDGTTSTYGAGGLRCDHDNYFSLDVEVKLYKDDKLQKVHRTTCSGPPVKTCSANTPAVAGSKGTWKTVVTGWADISVVYTYTATHSKTWRTTAPTTTTAAPDPAFEAAGSCSDDKPLHPDCFTIAVDKVDGKNQYYGLGSYKGGEAGTVTVTLEYKDDFKYDTTLCEFNNTCYASTASFAKSGSGNQSMCAKITLAGPTGGGGGAGPFWKCRVV